MKFRGKNTMNIDTLLQPLATILESCVCACPAPFTTWSEMREEGSILGQKVSTYYNGTSSAGLSRW